MKTMKKHQRKKTARPVAHYTLRNKNTGWYRHAEGGHDTSNPEEAVVLDKHAAEEWCESLREYEVIPLSEAEPL